MKRTVLAVALMAAGAVMTSADELGDIGSVLRADLRTFRTEVKDVRDLAETLSCLRPLDRDGAPDKAGFVIDSAEALFALPGCEGVRLPRIDFAKRTVLGKYAEGTGCEVAMSRRVFREPRTRVVEFVVTVEGRGRCDAMAHGWNWVSIPKVPRDYKVFFSLR